MGSLSAGLDNMLGLPLLLALSVFSTGAQNINCGQRTRRVIPVDVNQTFSFTSQRKGLAQYLPDTDCRALYKQGPNCHTIEFSCSQVAVKAGWKKPAKPDSDRYCWGDFMKVRRYGQKQRYCRNAKPAPEFNSTGPITVFFRAKADHKVSTGAVCKIECTEYNSMYKGIIESENYPSPYSNATLSETVKTTTGHVLKFTIKDFDVSPSDFFRSKTVVVAPFAQRQGVQIQFALEPSRLRQMKLELHLMGLKAPLQTLLVDSRSSGKPSQTPHFAHWTWTTITLTTTWKHWRRNIPNNLQ